MGTALRKLSAQGKFGGKGAGKLTSEKCKSLQNYYRGMMLNNQGNVDQMRTAIWLAFFTSCQLIRVPCITDANIHGAGTESRGIWFDTRE